MSRLKALGDVLPFKVFVRKAQVIGLYRQLLRSTRHIDDKFVQIDLRNQIIMGFKENKNLGDSARVSIALKEAQGHLAMLQDMGKRRDIASDSWINNSTEDDQRGRLGSGWPWQKD